MEIGDEGEEGKGIPVIGGVTNKLMVKDVALPRKKTYQNTKFNHEIPYNFPALFPLFPSSPFGRRLNTLPLLVDLHLLRLGHHFCPFLLFDHSLLRLFLLFPLDLRLPSLRLDIDLVHEDLRSVADPEIAQRIIVVVQRLKHRIFVRLELQYLQVDVELERPLAHLLQPSIPSELGNLFDIGSTVQLLATS